MECLRKFLAEVETDEDSDFDNEDSGPEDDLEDNFSDHPSFSEHDSESEEDGDSLNEECLPGVFLRGPGPQFYSSLSKTSSSQPNRFEQFVAKPHIGLIVVE
ncbi:hypothetical protein AVEN_8543-1 [Araneus ventricosus]|uniref:Uncharacterized protein n=1 Tax=Araneus ventricosus TaxID=182803 RepID=A0A4Y2FQD1_ARAVE|nr:hypothetical protein AVEN_8543-1 [Araneus ventricosus]